jgi:hypothetical protein
MMGRAAAALAVDGGPNVIKLLRFYVKEANMWQPNKACISSVGLLFWTQYALMGFVDPVDVDGHIQPPPLAAVVTSGSTTATVTSNFSAQINAITDDVVTIHPIGIRQPNIDK